jgi:hypothetical protein
MESLIDIIIPTFVNTHLFWIIPRRELLLRSGMNRVMKNCERKKIQDPEEICEDKVFLYILLCKGKVLMVILDGSCKH